MIGVFKETGMQVLKDREETSGLASGQQGQSVHEAL